jgi:1-deoxy-D-xylulose 5-phosphate reductoisomerase
METLKLARITILGSTGSIGLNTLDVIARHPQRFIVYALSAHSRIEQLAEQALETGARVVVVPNDLAANRYCSEICLAGKNFPFDALEDFGTFPSRYRSVSKP